jgi:hypothetical protein
MQQVGFADLVFPNDDRILTERDIEIAEVSEILDSYSGDMHGE